MEKGHRRSTGDEQLMMATVPKRARAIKAMARGSRHHSYLSHPSEPSFELSSVAVKCAVTSSANDVRKGRHHIPVQSVTCIPEEALGPLGSCIDLSLGIQDRSSPENVGC